MKTITIQELHEETEQWVRLAADYGELIVTDEGTAIARIFPEPSEPAVRDKAEVPYFARRVISPEFAKYLASGEVRPGTDITQMISEDRDRPILGGACGSTVPS
jgi:antitoxin (DNA-binding transcriptional repressor) of toxin-antitoxin stability system